MPRDATRTLLLIGEGPAQGRPIAAGPARAGWQVAVATDAEAALAMLAGDARIDAALLDANLPATSMAQLAAAMRTERPALPILLLVAPSADAATIAAMQAGATDFLFRPASPERLLGALDAATGVHAGAGELRPLSEKMGQALAFDEIVGSAPQFRAALAIAAKAARARVPVLIEGERGSGKQTVAQAIHAASPRARRPLVAFDCGAIAANLLESELFGHEKGAFPGAFERHVGRVQDAEGGTLFLDEVSALPPDGQVRLLRLLEAGEVQPIGGRGVRQVDVRVIAATSGTLLDEVAAGRFREDLYYRLATVQAAIPPLRHRVADLPALARHLLARIARTPGMRSLGITDEALATLIAYDWPGNVRQLHSVLFRAALPCAGDALTAADFPHLAARSASPAAALAGGAAGITLFEATGHLRSLEAIEADVIRLAIGHYRGRMTEVARRLGIGRSTLYRKLGELGIDSAA